MKTFKCLLCGKIYTQQSVPDSCEECGADVTDFEVVEIEGFKTSGKWPPIANDLIYFPVSNSFGVVSSITTGANPLINLKALIYDYRGETGNLDIQQPASISATISNENKIPDSLYLILREALIEKNLKLNYYSGKVEYSPVRLASGSHYYFINDKLALEGATDDGLSSGIHSQRFAQGNYFQDALKIKIADKILANVRSNVQKHSVSGVY
jgi:hypothetical protein